MENEVDIKLVKSVCFALLVCYTFYLVLYLHYAMVASYIGVIFLSIICSLPVKFLTELITAYLTTNYSKGVFGSMTKHSALWQSCLVVRGCKPWPSLKVLGTGIAILGWVSWKLGFFVAVASAFGLCFLELLLKFAGDVFNACRRKNYVEFNQSVLGKVIVLLIASVLLLLLIFLFASVTYEMTKEFQESKEYLPEYIKLPTPDEISLHFAELKTQYPVLELAEQYINSSQAEPIVKSDRENDSFIYYALAKGDRILDSYGIVLNLAENYASHVTADALLRFGMMQVDLLKKVSGLLIRSLWTNLNFAWEVIFFFTLVLLQVGDQATLLSRVLGALPIKEEHKNMIESKFNYHVIGLFKSLTLSAVAHYILTWLSYDLLGYHFKSTVSTLSALLALFPLCSSVVVTVPTFLWACVEGSYLRGVCVVLFQWGAVSAVDSYIYSRVFESLNPTLVSLAIGLGLFEFGLMGIIYGPLLAGVVMIIVEQTSQPKSQG